MCIRDSSKDDLRHYQNEVQKLTDRYIVRVEEIVEAKEREIMEV